MSKIDKLSITGIRSFDHRQDMAITFHTPLTLIVGMNGSGKTTIIECLKFATTGEMPPLARGTNAVLFVHDPSLTGEKEILAQVKISFMNTQGARLVCTRNMSVTVKKASRSFHQLESTIRMVKDGERAVISSRVGEINTMVPRYLGVSKAILENVIFCHQEESFWPLDTSNKLKEKFDAIFDAEKYTKAIENIKIMQKDKKLELVQSKASEEIAKSDNDKAKKLRKTINRLMDDIAKLKEEREGYERQGEEAQQELETIWEKMEPVKMTVSTLEGKRIARDTKSESVESMREHITELEVSDEELQNMLEQYENRVAVYDSDLQQHLESYEGLKGGIEETRDRISSKERELGSLEAQRAQYERQLQNRKQTVHDTAHSHDIRGVGFDPDDADVQKFMQDLHKKGRDANTKLDRFRSQAQDEAKRQQHLLNDLGQRRAAQTTSKETSREAMASNDMKIRQLQKAQGDVNVNEADKEALESKLQETLETLNKVKSEMTNSSWVTDIEDADRGLRTLDTRREELEKELLEATRQASATAELDLRRKENGERERKLKTMSNAHGDKIKAIVGNEWTPTSLEKTFEQVSEGRTADHADAEHKRNAAAHQLETHDAKIKELKKESQKVKADFDNAEKVLREAIPGHEPHEYHERVRELESERDVLKSNAEQTRVLLEYLEKCVKAAQENNTCRTCMRTFKKEEHKAAMVQAVQAQLNKYKTEAAKDSEVEDVENELKTAKQAGSDFETWERLQSKVIPKQQETLTQLEKERDGLVVDLERADMIVRDKKREKGEVEACSRDVHTIVKLHADFMRAEAEIADLSNNQRSEGGSRGVEAIQADKTSANEAWKKFSADKSAAVESLNGIKSRISYLELENSKTKGQLDMADSKLQQKKSLQAQEEEYKIVNIQERNKFNEADKNIGRLNEEIETEQTKYDADVASNARELNNLQEHANKLANSIQHLRMIQKDIDSYQERKVAQNLERCVDEMATLKAELESKEGDLGYTTRQINKLQQDKQEHEDTRRSIQENQRFRRDLRQLKKLEDDIAELEGKDAETELRRHKDMCGKWEKRRNEMSAMQASVSGREKSLDDQLHESTKDFESEYEDAAKKYKKAHIEVEVTKAAIEDLGRYGSALDKAIMKFHALKMQEINTIIDELWRRTYRGTDVDTIMIKSDSEVAKSSRSHNYRVVMMKQDTEMDMRGRCSAGQKVLACIIIRLALAECFGKNCGVIALDEPTTNLDSDNIKALAQSLADIIRIRKAQRNFQIIVITHDEEFLKHMNSGDYADTYYRVFRDHNQNSTIDSQNIAELM